MPERIFTPDPDFVRRSYLTEYRDTVNKKHSLNLETYHDLQRWSVDRPNDFWMSLWQYLPVKASVQPGVAIDESVPIDQIPEFYKGSRLNWAENMLQHGSSEIAVTALSETNLKKPDKISWDNLREQVRRYSSAMRASGLQKGDYVVCVGGSTISSLVLILATASIGAVFLSFATDAGERVMLDRISQLHPRLLFAESQYRYNGKLHNISSRIDSVWSQVSKPEHAELIHTTASTPAPSGWTSFPAFLSRSQSDDKLVFGQLPFHHPLVVLFSSGSTGPPKGIVHSHGGLTINGMKEHKLHYNHSPKSVHYHYAGIGWTLWNIMIGALLVGSPIVLYDGSPFHPTPLALLTAVLSTGVTSFGAGPRYFSELQKAQLTASQVRPLTKNMDKIPSAGALLTESTSLWIRDVFGPHATQISTSGGTELCGNFVHGTQTLPVYAGENAVICLGMDVHVFSPDGTDLPVGEAGELVCTKPFPNMPCYFVNDPDGERYRKAYFDKFSHVWTHGDYIRINPQTGGSVILGRSDGVLNPSGVRFGSGEIYTITERDFMAEIADAIVVAQQRPQDSTERVILFLQLRNGRDRGYKVPNPLRQRIEAKIASDLSRRHVPSYMFAVGQVPYNVNGKKLEIPLRAVLSEGEEGLKKRKFTEEERESLQKFLVFFNVEAVDGRAKL